MSSVRINFVRARMDSRTKELATVALESMRLSISELESGQGQQVNTIDDLIADFNENN